MSRHSEAVLWPAYVEHGVPDPQKNFPIGTVSVPDALQDNEVFVQLVYVSVDPYMRSRMRDIKNSYVPSFALGEPIGGYCLGQVIESRTESLPEGTYVFGPGLKWQDIQVVSASAGLRAVDVSVCKDTGLPLSLYLGALGMTGMTAWTSLERIGKPQPGDTVFVSAAAGAVGLVVGQLCKHVYGCKRVIGSAGSDEKVAKLSEFGYDAAFSYKAEKPYAALKRLAPDGIDMYYDNVGGETLEAALETCNRHARVVCCGSISGYDTPSELRYGVKNLFNVVSKQLLLQGFIVGSFAAMRDDFDKAMKQYVREGKVKHVEHLVTGGLAKAGQAFVDMMGGANIGKTVVLCGQDPYRK